MWRNWNPLNPPINPSYSSDEANNYESAEENENDPNVLVSPNRPHQSTSASPRSLLVPDPPPVEEVLASVDQRLRTLPSRQERADRRNAHRQAIEAAEEAAELAAAAVIIENDLVPVDNMVEFDQENGVDSATALENIRSVQCPFNKEDIVFWFSQLEDQLVVIGIKKQWTKKIALVRFLPPEVQNQVKSLLKLSQTAAGTDIYFRIKKQLVKLYGPKPEDAYMTAKNRVLSGRPSELGKALVEDICPAEEKLSGCHCDRIIWGMFREKIPIVIRNHIADMAFNKDTYEAVFDKADQVWDSNQASEPLPARPVAAVTAASSTQSQKGTAEVAAVQKNKSQKNYKNQNQNQQRQNSNKNQNQTSGGQVQAKKPSVNEDKLCRIHAKWKENATFCAAPWGCRMKNVWKEPQ